MTRVDDDQEFQPQVIDWDQFDELPEGEESQLDPESDAFEQVAPPLPGIYTWKIEFASDNPQVKYTDRKSAYYSARLEMTLISDDPDLSGAKVYPTVSTLIGRGKTNSTMASLMIKGGGSLSSTTASDKQVMKDFRNWILSEPILQADVDWQVGYSEENGQWKTIYSSYKHIPRNKDGTVPFRFEFKRKDGGVVQTGAMLQVKTFFAKGQTPKEVTNNSNGTQQQARSIANAPRKKPVVSDDEEISQLEEQVAQVARRK